MCEGYELVVAAAQGRLTGFTSSSKHLPFLHRTFGVLKQLGDRGYELEVVTAQYRFNGFTAGSKIQVRMSSYVRRLN